MAYQKNFTATTDDPIVLGNRSRASDAVVQVEGGAPGTLVFEARVEGASAWVPISLTPVAGGAAVSSVTAAGIWRTTGYGASGMDVRIRMSVAGTATVTAQAVDAY